MLKPGVTVADSMQSLGSFFSAQMAVKQMQKQGSPGSVVMIASITSHVNLPGYRMAGYVSTIVLALPSGAKHKLTRHVLSLIEHEQRWSSDGLQSTVS